MPVEPLWLKVSERIKMSLSQWDDIENWCIDVCFVFFLSSLSEFTTLPAWLYYHLEGKSPPAKHEQRNNRWRLKVQQQNGAVQKNPPQRFSAAVTSLSVASEHACFGDTDALLICFIYSIWLRLLGFKLFKCDPKHFFKTHIRWIN